MHPLGLLREWLHHVRAAAEPLPNRLRPAKSTVHPLLPLTLVDEPVAMTAQEVAPRPVQDRYRPSASLSGTDEPWPLSTEVARSPVKGHGLLYVFPFSAWTAPLAVGQDHSLRFLVPYHRTADRARLPTGPRPAQREPIPWRDQTRLLEISHIYAVT